jgi:hypothetical protein
MSLTLTNTLVDGATIDATELNDNFSDITDKFDGNITTADLNSNAGITNAQLANKHYEIVLNMTIVGTHWAACNAGDYVAFAGLPGDVDATLRSMLVGVLSLVLAARHSISYLVILELQTVAFR